MPLQQNNAFHNDPKFGRLLLVSLIAHGLIWVAFSADLFGTKTRYKPPVYYVDLIHKPVLNPQAGRPDPRPVSKPKPEPAKPAVQAATPAVSKPPVKPEVKPLVKPTPTPEPKPVPKPATKPVEKTVAKPDQRKEQKLQSALDEIRERQAREEQREALKDKLAKLREAAGAAATVPADVPVGMPDGQGNEVGVSALAFVQAFIQQNWVLSPYLIDQSRLANIEAKATLAYSAAGKLVRFRINTPSGNQQFDDSLKRAITKSDQLPQPLPQDLEIDVTFNLKDVAAARR
ncbi:MAG: TonB C-terminal domain-containing protein [Desulfuromonadales bacterium]